MGGGGGWEAGDGLHRPTGLFGVAMSTRLEGLKRRLTTTGGNIRPIPPI